jgi:3-hydroxyacyl-CoA dehydrogenase/enoyl-CoA hydratase/3-hydroxybutyryl-CoA epimerase
MLRRIHPTSNYRDLAECDLIIEAVFEQRAIKAEVTRKVETVTKPETVLASNTSTIAISELAEASIRPEQFIGMHFFSPVERMPLIEIIVGKKTTQETLARALDFARQLGKTPIVVNDAPGFYTSRCFSTYTTEGQLMLTEGVAPALIENAGRAAGMPVGPLAVADEVSLSLRYDVLRAAMQANGSSGDPPLGWELVRHFVEDLNRTGKKSGAGFYEYPAGRRKFLWPGLAKEYPPSPKQPSSESVQRRLLYVQALEAARCFESGVVTSPAEADLGSLLAWGFPRWTGGTLSYIDSIGIRVFVENCLDLAKQHGERFRPQQALLDRAERAESFYQDRRRDDALISRMSLHDE